MMLVLIACILAVQTVALSVLVIFIRRLREVRITTRIETLLIESELSEEASSGAAAGTKAKVAVPEVEVGFG